MSTKVRRDADFFYFYLEMSDFIFIFVVTKTKGDMKKIIVLLAIIIACFNLNAQQKFNDGIYSSPKSFRYKKVIDPIEMTQISYAHGVFNALGYWNANEIMVRFWRIEFSFYWDGKEYNDFYDGNWRETINDKSYISHSRHVTQYGFTGSKWGYAFNKYFSAGLVWSIGLDASYLETEDTHLHYAGVNYHDWEIGTYLGEHSEQAIGVYAKAQVNFDRFVIFASAQACTNMDITASIGIGWLFDL